MDALFRQLRTKYPEGGQQAKEGRSGILEHKTPPQRIPSFKGEKKRSESGVRRQSSRQMSIDYDSNVGEDYQTAIAAAAFVVKSLEETKVGDDRKGRQSRDASMTKIMSKADDTSRVPEPRRRSIKFSDDVAIPNLDAKDKGAKINAEPTEKKTEKLPEKTVGVAPSIKKKKLSFADTTGSSLPETALPAEKAIGPAPSFKRTPTFGDKSLERTASRKTEIAETKPDIPPLKQPQFQSPSPNKLGTEDNEVDAWEKAEIAKIREKHEKVKTKLLDWENKKKLKAKRKLERNQAELEKRREKAMQQYRSELSRIDGIVGGARSQAIENRRNEEFKAKEKANMIRLTGKVPAKCLCC